MTTDTCPLCLTAAATAIASSLNGSVTSDYRYFGFALTYKHCAHCGYIYRDRDDRIDNASYYENDYELALDTEESERMIFDGEGSTYSDYLVSFLAACVRQPQGKTCLDIGAGKGNFVSSLHRAFPEMGISAIEPSRSYQVLQNKKYLRHAYNAFFSSRDFSGEHFDYINMSEVLEHVMAPLQFLTEVKSIMKDDGLLMISVPNVENDRYDFLSPDHISRFTPASLNNLMNVAGFEVLRSDVLPRSASMLIVVKKSPARPVNKNHSTDSINAALTLIERAIADAKRISSEKVVFYGQGLIITYLLGCGIVSPGNITCIIDDNTMYQGKKWKRFVDIISLDVFLALKKDVGNIFLAMNECYHQQVIAKIPKGFFIFGAPGLSAPIQAETARPQV